MINASELIMRKYNLTLAQANAKICVESYAIDIGRAFPTRPSKPDGRATTPEKKLEKANYQKALKQWEHDVIDFRNEQAIAYLVSEGFSVCD